jgi:hypothetical protein
MNRLLIFLAIFLSLILPAEAQELWANTQAGMSVDQVKEIFPNAVPPESPVSSASETDMLLTIPSVTFADETYRVAFFFRDEKLDKVALSYVGKQSFESLLPVYNSVLAVMHDEHGKEVSHRSDRSNMIKNEEHTWFSDGRAVQMNMTSFEDADAVFAIRYQTKRFD